MDDLRHWIWLSGRAPSPGRWLPRVLDRFGTATAVWEAPPSECDRIDDVPPRVRQALKDKDLHQAEAIYYRCERLGLRLMTYRDADYPARLAALDEPPCLLYVQGTLPPIDEEPIVTVVGAREATGYGTAVARRLAYGLTRQGATVVTGTARGIDAAALRGALRAGGRPIAVLGNGVDVPYPSYHADLYEQIAARGALIGEYPPGTPPYGKHFPVRNRILAGLALGVVVVEGTEHSGSLITARWAQAEQRDVFAVPGPLDAPMSRGPNKLIHDGTARLIRGVEDILEEYAEAWPGKLRRLPTEPREDDRRPAPPRRTDRAPAPERPPERPAPRPTAKLDEVTGTDEERTIVQALAQADRTVDELVQATDLPVRRILTTLTMLQVRQVVEEGPGKRFRLAVELEG